MILGYGLFVGCTLLTMLAYKGVPLNVGPVLEATGYIYVTIFGVTIFHEKMNPKKIIALAMILVGILVYAAVNKKAPLLKGAVRVSGLGDLAATLRECARLPCRRRNPSTSLTLGTSL